MPNLETNLSASKADDISSVRRSAADISNTAREAATSALNSAASDLKEQVDAARSSAADDASNVASALRTAAEEMRRGSAQERVVGQIAESLADVSCVLRDKDLSATLLEVSDFARRNPLAFLGVAALAGFAASRFAKASGGTGLMEDRSAPSTSTFGDVS